MRWFIGLLMLELSFRSGFFTAAQIMDKTDVYIRKSPPLLMFSALVPIRVYSPNVDIYSDLASKTVNVGGVGSLDTANPVLLGVYTNSGSSQYVISATYERLTLYSYCSGQQPPNGNSDCSVQMIGVNYAVTFQKKKGKYQAVGGRGNITNSNFEITAFTNTKTPTVNDLVTAFRPQLMPRTDPPSELVRSLEIAIDSSFLTILPKA